MPALPTATDIVVSDLDAAERGFVLGLLVTGAGQADDGDGAAALAEPSRERCAEATRAIAALPRPERVRLMGLLAREVLAPVPAGIENVHPDTLRGVLVTESVQTIRLVTANGPPALRAAGVAALAARAAQESQEEIAPAEIALAEIAAAAADVVADLQRAVLASIVAVPPTPPGVKPKRWGRWLVTLTPEALLAEAMAAGADLLGASLRGADEGTVQRAAAHVGAPWSEQIVRTARVVKADGAEPSDDTRAASRARAQALVAATTPASDPRQTLERLGVRALGDRLGREDPDMALAVAQRLPAELGRQLLAASGL